MNFSDAFAESAGDLVGNFGEAVELLPYGKAPVPCTAVVVRTTESAPMGPKDARPVVDIIFTVNAMAGVTPDAIVWDRDSVAVAWTYRGALQTFRLGSKSALLAQSPGRFTVRVR